MQRLEELSQSVTIVQVAGKAGQCLPYSITMQLQQQGKKLRPFASKELDDSFMVRSALEHEHKDPTC